MPNERTIPSDQPKTVVTATILSGSAEVSRAHHIISVLVNKEVRLRAKLHSILNLRGITKFEVDVTLEIKDNPKPAFSGILVFLYHFTFDQSQSS